MLSCVDYDCGAVSDIAIVTVSLFGSPPHVCELGQGSSSLNHPLNHCPVHSSYNILRVDHHL